MTTFISLLRGINVSGQKKIKMDDLKAMYADLGFANVRTYIQSGNVIFQADASENYADSISTKIKEVWGFDVAVLVLSAEDFRQVFEEAQRIFEGKDAKKAVISFLQASPEAVRLQNLRAVQSGKDIWEVVGKAVYLYCPDGYGQTKISNQVLESKLKTVATTRNWNTVQALMEMVRQAVL